ncbi:MAG: fasciclin domain-containing protein, partial [Bacteroidaceae bacterium]|nr:fasciclin domain-containing protein [Bacteroidaceae bacterium]
MRIFKLFCILFAAFTIGAFSSCSEDIDTSNRYTFVGETMGDFLLNREDRFSSMIKIFEQAKMMGLLSTYGQHTLFLPEDTAVTLYLREQYELYESTLNDPNAETVWTGITSPYLEDLSDSMAVVIANTHLVPFAYEMVDMQEGVLDTRNYNSRYLSISYAVVDEMSRTLINNQSGIIEGDNLVENGVVHVVDAVVSPSTNTIAKHISDQPFFSLFAAALQKTAFENNLKDYALQLNGKDYDLGQKYATCFQCGDAKQMSARYPHTYFAKYTAFVETDDVFIENGIDGIDKLIEKCYEWYGREDAENFTSPKNALYKFVAYHFLNRELNYNLMVQYKLEHDSYKSEGERGLRSDIDRVDYFETMLGTLVKVCKPLSSSKPEEYQNLFLNFSHRSTKQEFMRKHLDVCIYDMTTFNNMDEKYADFTQSALNGVVHPINRILVYNEAEMQGNVLNERMRFDIASILPEL